MPTRALRAPTSNGVRVARRGLHAVDLHSLGGIRVRTARFESTTPKVPGGTRPLRTGELAAKPVIFPRDAGF